MIFHPTAVAGAWLIEPEPQADHRGFFARLWCQREFEARGLDSRLVQASISVSTRKGTLRGLHYQAPPHAETKLVRCTRGAIHDVIVDLRPASPTYLRHAVAVLAADDRRALYVPAHCAHGFQTLVDDVEVLYQMSEFHCPDAARGVRWDDPLLAIEWPPDERIIAERDRRYPDLVVAG